MNGDPLEKLRFINTKNSILGVSAISYKKDKSLELISFQLKNGEFTNPEPVYEHAFKRYKKGIAPIAYIPESNEDLETSISRSFDRTKVLFTNTLSNQDTKNEDQLVIAVFDAELNLQWDKIQDVGYPDKKLEIMSAFVADNGKEVFVSASLVKNKKNYDYKIFRITENDFREYELVLNEKVNPATLALFYKESEQTLIVGGLYVLRSDGIAHGVFGGKFDLSKDFNDELNYFKFDKEDKDKNTKADYSIVGMASLANGNFQILMEGRFISSSGTSTGPTAIYYHYKDLVFITIDGEGGLVKTDKIDRDALGMDVPRNGHLFFLYGDYTYLLYDSKITKEDKQKYKLSGLSIGHNIAKLYCFDQYGKLVRQKMLFTTKDGEYFCYGVNGAVYGNQLYFLGVKYMTNFFTQYQNQISMHLGSINLDDFH